MLVIRTGKPGHGKTLNTIKEVDKQASRSGRVVYYHNINGLQIDKLAANWYEFDDPEKWYELPHNSIIVIDEAQGWFGTRDPRHKPGEHLTAFETMRHSGFEVHLITQDPRFLDTHARRLANSHIHFWRVMKSKQLLRFESEVVIERVDNMASFKDADKKRLRIDSKMFEKYTSSNAEHHFKFKPSKKLIYSLLVFAVTFFLLFRVYGLYSKNTATVDVQEQSLPSTASLVTKALSAPSSFVGMDSKPKVERKIEELDYFEARTPRIKNIPSTAPIYDELTAPVTYPKLSCIQSKSEKFKSLLMSSQTRDGVGCRCYTQQATPVDVDYDFCIAYIKNGFFDHAIPDSLSIQNSERSNLTQAKNKPAASVLF